MIFGFNIVDVATVFFACAGMLFSIVNFWRTGNISKFAQNIKTIQGEVDEMVYKTSDERVVAQQSFTPYKDEYVYNERTKSLEKTGEQIDVQKMIDSALPTALETVLKKYLGSPSFTDNADDKKVVDYTDNRDELELMTDYINLAEDMRDKYNLPVTMSTKEVFDYVSKRANDMKSFVDKHVNLKVKEEGKENA